MTSFLGDLRISPENIQDKIRPEVDFVTIAGTSIPRYTGEFWTAKQRQASSIHEISYRACFKPQLPRFFIDLLTRENDVVYDPFSGRGTTAIEAGLLGRKVIANDANPLGRVLTEPRFHIPDLPQIEETLNRIKQIKLPASTNNLSMFYHPKTNAEILRLKRYLAKRERSSQEDNLDRWIRMVATNRLTGHSKGFFSVYTLPPNQAVTRESQKKINKRLRQKPKYRDTHSLILKKSRSLLRDLDENDTEKLLFATKTARFLSNDSRNTPSIESESVQLTVTSPPFLDVVNYGTDNWLRCWFNSIDAEKIANRITTTSTVDEWSVFIGDVFQELFRLTKNGGWVAFEVGEVRGGRIRLEEYVVPRAHASGFRCAGLLINRQQFTKTSNIWGISNNRKGTNTNRIVLFRKEL
ncbi:MAG: site-specific DNA-methyltransferase [Ignavibacteriales bacterium]|nr:site-specific DNA-methyltransferase [Ignavibacteriales bacterium]